MTICITLASDSSSSCSGLHISRLIAYLLDNKHLFFFNRILSVNGCFLNPIGTTANPRRRTEKENS